MKPRTRVAILLGALGGLALAIALVAWFGAGSVLSGLEAVGWRGLLVLAALHFVPMTICGAAWRAVTPPGTRPSLAIVTASRILRDAGAELLPISAAGGAVMGARGMMLAQVPAAIAFATTIVDITVELIAQLGFIAIGILVLLQGARAPQVGAMALAGLAIGIVATIGFVLAQRAGLFRLLERLSRRLARGNKAWTASGDSIHDAIRDLYGRHGGIAAAIALHFVAWCVTAFEAWVALRLIGAALPFPAVFMVTSLVYALRSAAFFVPSGWGIQEGGFVLLGALVGLPAGAALALSLAMRAREVTLGVPALLLWQAVETRHVRRALL